MIFNLLIQIFKILRHIWQQCVSWCLFHLLNICLCTFFRFVVAVKIMLTQHFWYCDLFIMIAASVIKKKSLNLFSYKIEPWSCLWYNENSNIYIVFFNSSHFTHNNCVPKSSLVCLQNKVNVKIILIFGHQHSIYEKQNVWKKT